MYAPMRAAFTRMSQGPNCCSTALVSASTSCSEEMSARSPTHSPPAFVTCSITEAGSRTSTATTRAPRSASPVHSAPPIEPAAPVTTATLPSCERLFMSSFLSMVPRSRVQEEVLDLDRQPTYPPADRVVDGIGNGRSDPDNAQLARSLCAERVDMRIRDVEEMHVDVGDVGVGGHEVAGKVGRDELVQMRMHWALFQERHSDAPRDAADRLAARGLRVEHGANVVHAECARNPHDAEILIDTHLDELCAEVQGCVPTGERRRRHTGCGAQRPGQRMRQRLMDEGGDPPSTAGFDLVDPGSSEPGSIAFPAGRIARQKQLTVLRGDLGGMGPMEWRPRIANGELDDLGACAQRGRAYHRADAADRRGTPRAHRKRQAGVA